MKKIVVIDDKTYHFRNMAPTMNKTSVLKYTLIIVTTIIVLFALYVKLSNRFWSRQPIFHYFDLKHWVFPNQLIEKTLPKINKFYNSKILFNKIEILDDEKKALITSFLTAHYLPNEFERYNPTKDSVFDYLKSHNSSCYFSLLEEKKLFHNLDKKIQTLNSQIVSFMTLRPYICVLNNTKFPINFIDFLCVHSEKRGQRLAPEIIYSTYYNNAYNDGFPISFFKNENRPLKYVVPFVVYKNYMFDIKYWDKNVVFDQPYIKVTFINDGNFNWFYDFYEEIYKSFKSFIAPNINNLKLLCGKKHIFIGFLTVHGVGKACYMFRNTYTTYNKIGSIELFASYNDCDNDDLFVLGFFVMLSKLNKEMSLGKLFIENISNNDKIIRKILKRYTEEKQMINSYYFYNFSTIPLKSNAVFIV